ncbi:hypothetical protein RRG08_038932 [Elysia crispata]|uniref:Uncharacterized protein n=1 Tax=Elysia crispata TaxID=231223 RepID=A0AAE0Y706_9GAST|nr:hypothetical protein RRG08_038932 [Elysia crispata]
MIETGVCTRDDRFRTRATSQRESPIEAAPVTIGGGECHSIYTRPCRNPFRSVDTDTIFFGEEEDVVGGRGWRKSKAVRQKDAGTITTEARK